MKWLKPFSVGIGIGLIGGAGLMFAFSPHFPVSPTSTKLRLIGPDGAAAVEFEVQGQELNYKAILEHIFNDPLLGPGAKEWLQESMDLYYIRDEALVAAIESRLCEPIPETPLAARLEKARACAAQTVSAGLRQLAHGHRPPFHYVGTEGRLGVPQDVVNQPRAGHANVCKERGLLGKDLEILDRQSGETVQVKATGYYRCTGYSRFPDIQLCPTDALHLFGGRPVGEYEDVVVVPL